MVMSSFDHGPAAGERHRGCAHLIDQLRTATPEYRPVLYWCASHGPTSGLMCADDARRHEADEHHGDASFTSSLPAPLGFEIEPFVWLSADSIVVDIEPVRESEAPVENVSADERAGAKTSIMKPARQGWGG